MNIGRIGIHLATVLVAGLFAVSVQAAEPAPALSVNDCIKCHTSEPGDIAKAGGKHKTDITCVDCHTSHRPSSKNNIPQCSNCHTGKPHFELQNCLGCHKNPHAPKNIVLPTKITDPCLSCHTQQIKQLKDYPSKHTQLFCSDCHNVHGAVPECTKCHQKLHSAEMTVNVCKNCHKAHMPKVVIYGANVPNKECAACHKKAYDFLNASATKHRTLGCAFCHKAQHKMVPKCQDCHGTPHPAPMLAKFQKCQDCHNIAHDLNHWQQ
jgi:predicted CXXCH cytochrome family protein